MLAGMKFSITGTQHSHAILKGAVVVTLCQNEADVNFQMDIDHHISITEQAGNMRLIDLPQSCNHDIYFPPYF